MKELNKAMAEFEDKRSMRMNGFADRLERDESG
jgi:hypothetical protein